MEVAFRELYNASKKCSRNKSKGGQSRENLFLIVLQTLKNEALILQLKDFPE